MSKEFLVGLYKEVGKNPDIIKIKNQKDYLERLVDGEYTTLDYDDYVIIYKKKSENLLANVYVDRYSKIGISIKGKIFIVGKDEKGNFISLNKNQLFRCTNFLVKESFNYKNFDEHGRYIPRSKRNNSRRIFNTKKQNIEHDKVSEQTKEQVVENAIQQTSTNFSLPTIQVSDEQTLNMILKITFTILDFIKDIVEDSNKDE